MNISIIRKYSNKRFKCKDGKGNVIFFGEDELTNKISNGDFKLKDCGYEFRHNKITLPINTFLNKPLIDPKSLSELLNL